MLSQINFGILGMSDFNQQKSILNYIHQILIEFSQSVLFDKNHAQSDANYYKNE